MKGPAFELRRCVVRDGRYCPVPPNDCLAPPAPTACPSLVRLFWLGPRRWTCKLGLGARPFSTACACSASKLLPMPSLFKWAWESGEFRYGSPGERLVQAEAGRGVLPTLLKMLNLPRCILRSDVSTMKTSDLVALWTRTVSTRNSTTVYGKRDLFDGVSSSWNSANARRMSVSARKLVPH